MMNVLFRRVLGGTVSKALLKLNNFFSLVDEVDYLVIKENQI